MKKRRILRSERGFTLVELGIVMAIIAILAAVAYPTYTGMRKRAYVAEANAIIQEIRVEKWAEFLESGAEDWRGVSGVGNDYDTDYWTFEVKDNTTDGKVLEITARPRGGANKADEFTVYIDTNGRVVDEPDGT